MTLTRWTGPTPKPSRTARKKAERVDKLELKSKENAAMAKARRRDKVCRFPMCGCRKLQLRTEVSHVRHRGMGGNPSGDRTTTDQLVLLCTHRHQFGLVSRHQGTLRSHYLTDKGYDGPVAWEVDLSYDDIGTQHCWMEVARESAPGVLEPLNDEQRSLLTRLAEMDA